MLDRLGATISIFHVRVIDNQRKEFSARIFEAKKLIDLCYLAAVRPRFGDRLQ